MPPSDKSADLLEYEFEQAVHQTHRNLSPTEVAASKKHEMLLIIGTIRLPADRLQAARPIMATMVEASRAEPGCLEYSYAEDVFDPGLIHVKERWTNRTALGEHFNSVHLANWRACWPLLGISERNLYLYDIGEPQPT